MLQNVMALSDQVFFKNILFRIYGYYCLENLMYLQLTTENKGQRIQTEFPSFVWNKLRIIKVQQFYKYLKMSSQTLKQLRIKTSTVKRLKKQYISYDKQTKSITKKLQDLEAQPETQDRQIDVKKQNQFLSQSQSVLSNVKQKLIESFEALAQFLSEKQNEEGLEGTEEKKQAEEVVLDVETFLQNITQ